MNATQRVPAGGAVGGLMIAVGLGIALWFGWDWYHAPRWTESEIQASVELNLALDLSRLPEDSINELQKAEMRNRIRQEVEAEIATETAEPRGFTFAGLIIAVFGLIQMRVRRWLFS